MFNLKLLVSLLGLTELVLAIPKRTENLITCLDNAGVPLISSSSADYQDTVKPFNLRVPFFPTAVAVPETTAHVSSSLICAQKFKVKVSARSGGHSYAGYGLGGADGSLMIDMKKFKGLKVDPATNIATIGAGNRLGDVASGLFAQGKRALPHGLCPGVGISGHALHGGYGMTSRMWGTTLDTIVEMEVVLANGTVVTTSKSSNPDLFWALRGAGSSFGIVTNFKLKTLEAPANGVRFTYSFAPPTVGSIVSQKVAIFQAMQDYAETTAPKELTLRLWTLTNVFEITGVYWGTRADFQTVIAPLTAKWPKFTVKIEEFGWLDMLMSLANGEQLPQPLNYTKHETFFAKSIVAPTKVTTNALTSFFNFHQNNRYAVVNWWVIADLYGGKHSNISTHGLDEAAYAVRDSLFTFQLYATSYNQLPPYPPTGIDFMNRMVKSMISAQPETKFKAYPNYIDPTLSATEAHELYYGSQYARLKKIKKQVDPQITLWNPQAIGVEGF